MAVAASVVVAMYVSVLCVCGGGLCVWWGGRGCGSELTPAAACVCVGGGAGL